MRWLRISVILVIALGFAISDAAAQYDPCEIPPGIYRTQTQGGWGGDYEPRPNVHWQVMGSEFTGNIDPSKIYKDNYGEDRSQLYFITKGKFIILETNSETRKVRSVKGHIYVTGWLDTEYNATGEIIITSDKKSYKTFSWQAEGKEGLTMFDLFN